MNMMLMKLLGKVEVLTGSGGILKSSNVIIDKFNNNEIIKSSSPSHFQSKTVDIKSKKMHYDANTKKLELMNEVLAIYE